MKIARFKLYHFQLLLTALVTVACAIYPIQSAFSEVETINYDDPNLRTTDGYVTGASDACVGRGGDIHQCMTSYAASSEAEGVANDADSDDEVAVAKAPSTPRSKKK